MEFVTSYASIRAVSKTNGKVPDIKGGGAHGGDIGEKSWREGAHGEAHWITNAEGRGACRGTLDKSFFRGTFSKY